MLDKLMCECNSFKCSREIEISVEEYSELSALGQVIISHDCANGPEPTDVLVEERNGYNVYEEKL